MVNGREVGVLEFDAPRNHAPRRVEIPAGIVGPDGAARVELVIAHPRAPAALGISTDPRPLGVMVRSIHLL